MSAQQKVVLLLVDELADDLPIVAVHRDDALAAQLEVGNEPETLDTDAVAVAEQAHAVGIAFAPEEPRGKSAAQRIEDVAPADVAEVNDVIRPARAKDVHCG